MPFQGGGDVVSVPIEFFLHFPEPFSIVRRDPFTNVLRSLITRFR
jgi:hypothetical protein